MEITANALQNVAVGQSVVFTDTAVEGNCSTLHREGSGLVLLRGLTNQCRARFRVSFGANVGLPEGATVIPVSLSLALDGEPIAPAVMISTPAAAEEYNNVYRSIFIDIPRGCCMQVSVENTSTGEISVQNANLIVERVA